jgi:hypothetical protein
MLNENTLGQSCLPKSRIRAVCLLLTRSVSLSVTLEALVRAGDLLLQELDQVSFILLVLNFNAG